MNKQELVAAVAEKIDRSNAEAKRSVDACIEAISESLGKGDSVQVLGFGTFEVRRKAARTGRNPQTGKEIEIAARSVPAFKPGKGLKDRVEKTHLK